MRRNVTVLAATLFALGIGEELWQSFLPAYIVALGGSGAIVGLFGSARDFLDGVYQLPGGWVSHRFGFRQAIRLFTAIAILGYAAYAAAWSWPMVFVGLAGAMAWKAGAFPATFALIGESLPSGQRIRGFTLQSLAVRVPRVLAAPVGGLLVWRFGLVAGVRIGIGIAILLAILALVIQKLGFARSPHVRTEELGDATSATRSLTTPLKRLLVADCLVRIGESVAATFIVLYVTEARGVSLPLYGVFYAVQQAVALVLYLPAARLAAAIGSRTLVGVTFAFFALFPLAVLWAPGSVGLWLAFVLGGFKEIGEPARKAMIVDLCRPTSRAREVGAYYFVRNLLVVPGGLIGGLIWQQSPALVLQVAGIVSTVGLLVYILNHRGHSPDYS